MGILNRIRIVDIQENDFFLEHSYIGNCLNALNVLLYIAYLVSLIVKRRKYFGCAVAIKQK